MADVNQIVSFILSHEDPNLTGKVTVDSGGTTRWGISSANNPGVDVANLTLFEARAIYIAKYVTPFHLADLRDQDVANACGDAIVNPGPSAGAKCIQRAINLYRPNLIAEDGVIGPDTISHLNGFAREDILPRLRVTRVLYYMKDVQEHPEKAVYLTSWLVRACG